LVSNSRVIKAWLNGHEATARHMSTDGVNLYSYALCIARGMEVYDYTARGLGFKSNTTSRHISLAKEGVKNV
tara:strand:+ start:1846 stop:2061 length:216 start_codon:yes stop_codon:yes gene_type:complete